MASSSISRPDSKIRFCSVVSAESGEDSIGSSWHSERYVLVELPLPWKYNALESIHAPEGLGPLLLELWALGHRWGFIGFAPDEDESVANMTRVMDYQLPPAPFARYDRTEYLFPAERVVDLLRLLATDPENDELAVYRVDAVQKCRDVFVCTHGAIDACCATFGYPIYTLLRHMAHNPELRLRVWRCTHFDGHRFAATVLDMPEGRYWGHLDARDLGPLIRRDKPFAELRHRYRGWAALPHPLQQVAEGAAFLRAGWAWTRYPVTVSDPPEADAEQIVRFEYAHHDTGEHGSVEVEIIPDGTIATMQASNSEELHDAPQFKTFIRSATHGTIPSGQSHLVMAMQGEYSVLKDPRTGCLFGEPARHGGPRASQTGRQRSHHGHVVDCGAVAAYSAPFRWSSEESHPQVCPFRCNRPDHSVGNDDPRIQREAGPAGPGDPSSLRSLGMTEEGVRRARRSGWSRDHGRTQSSALRIRAGLHHPDCM